MRLLVVDDNRINLKVLTRLVSSLRGCTPVSFDVPGLAYAAAEQTVFDLALVDYVMPDIDGVTLIGMLRALPGWEHVPIVMVTGEDERDIRIRAVEAGATDFLTKPVDPHELRLRLTNLLSLRKAQVGLQAEVDAAVVDLLHREEEIIWRLARAIEYRDGGTGDHISRVAEISRLLAQELGLQAGHVRNIYLAAPLHDVGKIGVSDAILNKPGRLTDAEMASMREHVSIGGQILADGTSDLIRIAAIIAGSHHERWDGAGYPRRLKGTEIPIEGRIVALADVFDALCTVRPYKHAWTLADARAEILRNRGLHFDPACVDAFEAIWPAIVDLMERSTRSAA